MFPVPLQIDLGLSHKIWCGLDGRGMLLNLNQVTAAKQIKLTKYCLSPSQWPRPKSPFWQCLTLYCHISNLTDLTSEHLNHFHFYLIEISRLWREKKEVRNRERKNAIKSDHFVLPVAPKGSVHTLLGPKKTKRGKEAAEAATTVGAKAEEEHSWNCR